jgi:hypothetical protein
MEQADFRDPTEIQAQFMLKRRIRNNTLLGHYYGVKYFVARIEYD